MHQNSTPEPFDQRLFDALIPDDSPMATSANRWDQGYRAASRNAAKFAARFAAERKDKPCGLCGGDGEVWMSGSMVPCICDNVTTALCRVKEQLADLQERCERLSAVAAAAENLVGIEWPLHKDGIVDMGATHHIHQLQHWLDELQVGDLD